MKQVVLMTGATGALGRPLLAALRAHETVARVHVLARRDEPGLVAPGTEIIRGDLSSCDRCPTDVTAILHAAADTRFSAPLDAARAANVEGTRSLLRFAERCPKLERIGFLSTCHVAGRRTGTIRADELDHAAGFVNHYEQSKYEAELLLRSRMGALPIAVYRLSTVFGDSRTGDVGRRGGIHQALRFFYHSLAPMIPGRPDSPVDLIASDYAVAAVTHLFCERFDAGATAHLCAGVDTLPLAELLDLTHACFVRDRPAWRTRAIEIPPIVDLATFELFARSVEEIGDSALRQCVAAIEHFAPQLAFPKHFDDTACRQTLDDAGIVRPRVRDFYPRVISHLIETRWGSPVADAVR
jgi:nucleoside-diphosphate-sugar epimerase